MNYNLSRQQEKYSALTSKFLENKVRFSLKYTKSTKKHCILKCSKEELLWIYKTLGEKEELTWSNFRSLPKKTWISIEKKDNDNYKMLKKINSNFSTYGHIRIKIRDTPWRIFWWLKDDLFYIILIDIKWDINH